MNSGLISDSQITASSEKDLEHKPEFARYNVMPAGKTQYGWRPLTDENSWLQVDFKVRMLNFIKLEIQIDLLSIFNEVRVTVLLASFLCFQLRIGVVHARKHQGDVILT